MAATTSSAMSMPEALADGAGLPARMLPWTASHRAAQEGRQDSARRHAAAAAAAAT